MNTCLSFTSGPISTVCSFLTSSQLPSLIPCAPGSLGMTDSEPVTWGLVFNAWSAALGSVWFVGRENLHVFGVENMNKNPEPLLHAFASPGLRPRSPSTWEKRPYRHPEGASPPTKTPLFREPFLWGILGLWHCVIGLGIPLARYPGPQALCTSSAVCSLPRSQGQPRWLSPAAAASPAPRKSPPPSPHSGRKK